MCNFQAKSFTKCYAILHQHVLEETNTYKVLTTYTLSKKKYARQHRKPTHMKEHIQETIEELNYIDWAIVVCVLSYNLRAFDLRR